MTTRCFGALSLAFLLCGGCHPPPAPTAALGPFDSAEPRALFARTVASARERGYDVLSEDLYAGELTVASKEAQRCPEDPARYDLTFYQGGWIQVMPRGCGATMEDGRLPLPDAVHRDYVAFTAGLLRPVGSP